MERKVLRVLGCGSRSFNGEDWVCNKQGIMEKMSTYLDKHIYTDLLYYEYQNYDIEFVEGLAKGADAYFKGFAERHNIECKHFPAQWDKFGKSAGYRRNAEMIEYIKEADSMYTIVLWDGVSRGTRHTIDLCIKNNIPVYVYLYNKREWIEDINDYSYVYTKRKNS